MSHSPLIRRLYLFWLPTIVIIAGMVYLSQMRYKPEHEAQYAFNRLNFWRTQSGLSPFESSPLLQKAALNHARYLSINPDGHDELSHSNPHFTGKTPQERATAVGYPAAVTENLTISTWSRSGKRSVDNLMTALYHRLALLSPDDDEAGVAWVRGRYNALVIKQGYQRLRELCESVARSGSLQSKKLLLTTQCMGQETQIPVNPNEAPTPKNMVVKYPIGSQIEPIYNGTEQPNPMPNYGKTGNPISIAFYGFNSPYPIEMMEFNLYQNHTRIPEVKILTDKTDPNHLLSPTEFALFPIKPLDYQTEYRVEFKYRHNREIKTETWTFKTRKK